MSLNQEIEFETEEQISYQMFELFPRVDCSRKKKDGRFCPNDLKFVLKKIKAPKKYIDEAEEIIWEVDDRERGYLTLSDITELMVRTMKTQRLGKLDEPTRLVNVLQFLSKDPKMTGLVDAKECVLLLHNRFGGKMNSTNLRNLFMSNQDRGKLTFRQFLDQIRVREMMKQR